MQGEEDIWGGGISSDVLKSNPQYDSRQIAQEMFLEYGYIGASGVSDGYGHGGSMDEHSLALRYIVAPQVNKNVFLRLGAGWERTDFGMPNKVLLPDKLQSVNLILGVDASLSDKWLMRFEAEPGFYSDFQDISGRDFNSPLTLGFSYLVNEKLQWAFGVRVNWWSEFPVIPGFGVRWQFADRWTLNFMLPKPRLEYELCEKATLYLGADLRGGVYRVAKNFGDGEEREKLNDALVDYQEIRTGAGVSWKIQPNIHVGLEAGCVVSRHFDFYRVGVDSDADPAPYVQISSSAKF